MIHLGKSLKQFQKEGIHSHCWFNGTTSIAIGISLKHPQKLVVYLDSDGTVIMHMGALAINGQCELPNFTHVLLNDGTHDSFGGIPYSWF